MTWHSLRTRLRDQHIEEAITAKKLEERLTEGGFSREVVNEMAKNITKKLGRSDPDNTTDYCKSYRYKTRTFDIFANVDYFSGHNPLIEIEYKGELVYRARETRISIHNSGKWEEQFKRLYYKCLRRT